MEFFLQHLKESVCVLKKCISEHFLRIERKFRFPSEKFHNSSSVAVAFALLSTR